MQNFRSKVKRALPMHSGNLVCHAESCAELYAVVCAEFRAVVYAEVLQKWLQK